MEFRQTLVDDVVQETDELDMVLKVEGSRSRSLQGQM